MASGGITLDFTAETVSVVQPRPELPQLHLELEQLILSVEEIHRLFDADDQSVAAYVKLIAEADGLHRQMATLVEQLFEQGISREALPIVQKYHALI